MRFLMMEIKCYDLSCWKVDSVAGGFLFWKTV